MLFFVSAKKLLTRPHRLINLVNSVPVNLIKTIHPLEAAL